MSVLLFGIHLEGHYRAIVNLELQIINQPEGPFCITDYGKIILVFVISESSTTP